MYYHEVTIPPAGQLAIKVANAETHKLRIIPNPTQGQFNLELPKTIEGLAELAITNFNGRMIHNGQLQISPGATLPLDLSQQPPGVYLVHVRVGNQLYQEKLVLIK